MIVQDLFPRGPFSCVSGVFRLGHLAWSHGGVPWVGWLCTKLCISWPPRLESPTSATHFTGQPWRALITSSSLCMMEKVIYHFKSCSVNLKSMAFWQIVQTEAPPKETKQFPPSLSIHLTPPSHPSVFITWRQPSGHYTAALNGWTRTFGCKQGTDAKMC